MKRKDFHYVAVDYLDSPDDPWATIIFMYRGKSKFYPICPSPLGPIRVTLDEQY